jgi:hypothetical protein
LFLDWKSEITIVDYDTQLGSREMKLSLFYKLKEMPKIHGAGDAVVMRKMKVRKEIVPSNSYF